MKTHHLALVIGFLMLVCISCVKQSSKPSDELELAPDTRSVTAGDTKREVSKDEAISLALAHLDRLQPGVRKPNCPVYANRGIVRNEPAWTVTVWGSRPDRYQEIYVRVDGSVMNFMGP